jgi:hypothetical protein
VVLGCGSYSRIGHFSLAMLHATARRPTALHRFLPRPFSVLVRICCKPRVQSNDNLSLYKKNIDSLTLKQCKNVREYFLLEYLSVS